MSGRATTASRKRALITVKGREYSLKPGESLAFGRIDGPGIVGLDPDDYGISRRAGEIHDQLLTWVLANVSAKRTLFVEYPDIVLLEPVPKGTVHVLQGPCTILVSGRIFTHTIDVKVPAPSMNTSGNPEAEGSTVIEFDRLSGEDHRALVAVAYKYLRRWPEHDENPLSYREASDLIGVSDDAIRRRIDNIRENWGWTDPTGATVGSNALRGIIEYAIAQGALQVKDLSLIDEREGST